MAQAAGHVAADAGHRRVFPGLGPAAVAARPGHCWRHGRGAGRRQHQGRDL